MNKVDKHRKICEELNKIYIAKNHDYGDSFGETFKKLGIISAVTRITDKTNRLQALCKSEAEVDESVEDTLMDLANYAILTLIETKEYVNADCLCSACKHLECDCKDLCDDYSCLNCKNFVCNCKDLCVEGDLNTNRED